MEISKGDGAPGSYCFGSFAEAIRIKGWAVTGPVVPRSTLHSVANKLAADPDPPHRGGMRNLLDLDCVREMARSAEVVAAASSVLGRGCFAVRGLLFHKPPDANWSVPWHQDLTIAVREVCAVEGFGPWSVKEGVNHVQAPPALLERMLAVRVHLDECGADSGPLRLAPGSHLGGILRPHRVDTWIAEHETEVGLAETGSILAFRPLLLHASSSACEPSRRRVVHIEYAAFALPHSLEWRWRV